MSDLRGRSPVPVAVEALPGGRDPLDLFAVVSSQPWPVLLHSARTDSSTGRFSILAWDPFLVLKFGHGRGAISSRRWERVWKGDPFPPLRETLDSFPAQRIPGVPFAGGAIGYLGYGLRRYVHPLAPSTTRLDPWPDLWLAFYDRGVVVDHVRRSTFLVATGFPETREERRREKRSLDLGRLRETVTSIPPRPERFEPTPGGVVHFETSRDAYLDSVRRIQEYLVAGEIYQANFSHRIRVEGDWRPIPLYRALMEKHPACFSALLTYQGHTVLCASPERLIRLEGNRAETRPIKGTRRRETDPETDREAIRSLATGAKERAENVMIVDLARNDLGTVCQTGTVTTDEICRVESLPSVHHLVSTVSGRLQPESDRVDLVRALFPGGSMTGAPKIRAMEIIDEMEKTERGVYSGSIGYFSFDGDLDLNIVIRTLVVSGRSALLQVGGAILVDSSPDQEYDETMDKARPLLNLLRGESGR